MNEKDFEKIAAEEFANVPEHFAKHIENVALLVEEDPSNETRTEEKLTNEQTLLGLYKGIPMSNRGSSYGIGGVMPDTITLYRNPIYMIANERLASCSECVIVSIVRDVVRETLWHEIGHAFGLSEYSVDKREDVGTNHYPNEFLKD